MLGCCCQSKITCPHLYQSKLLYSLRFFVRVMESKHLLKFVYLPRVLLEILITPLIDHTFWSQVEWINFVGKIGPPTCLHGRVIFSCLFKCTITFKYFTTTSNIIMRWNITGCMTISTLEQLQKKEFSWYLPWKLWFDYYQRFYYSDIYFWERTHWE